MVFPAGVLPKVAAQWLFTFHRAARKLRRHAFQLYYRNTTTTKPSPVAASPQQGQHATTTVKSSAAVLELDAAAAAATDGTVVFDMHGALLRSTSLFPYFMLVAFEGGSLLRAMLLLCALPLVWALGGERSVAGIRVMAFVAFAGLSTRDMDLVARAVMPKHYMAQLNAAVYERLWLPSKKKVVVTAAPRVMSEWFLKEYMAADAVVGLELRLVTVGRRRYFTGVLDGPEPSKKALKEAIGAEVTMADVGIVSNSNPVDQQLFVPYCKEVYVVSRDSTKSATLPRDKYPKPLIFHDGRLAFLPTPSAMLAFFLFLPLGVILSVIRISIGIVLPYKINFLAGAIFGWMDPVAFFANPAPAYRVEFLGAVPREWTRAAGERTGVEVANWVQRRLGEALGFECTGLTRRDKYMMLAGNDGVVAK
ncbi:hypothetical protein HU200_047444 [Digitaria exilis]|uniref:Glycerol-3-phosphate acyltransferase RAM2/GPAT1-8 HAD-like domain-containing protein n=1 Tax=Digitaria exilis TaxID=1010633 RepID=A0A835B2N8_9POAL|nr:hypothetical protein HU200_047444 [Digitaria exilis]CAB3473673.1 unnamed protein product [Digitaria exilis]